ncbi:unnamed protein product [Bemisia tabaci]|uniref:Uncharacterized protein n=2 Tax=Bemisia tabaci TaxID=7038 RepID=A0A9P0AER0_BEMTA|nr:unnamed protein product [Bemisia tabaci]
MGPLWSIFLFCLFAALGVELSEGRAKISDVDFLDMDRDLNSMSNYEIITYGDTLYLRMAKAQGATEVVAYFTENLKERKMPISMEDINALLDELTKKFIDPALKTRDRMEVVNTVWNKRANTTNNWAK